MHVSGDAVRGARARCGDPTRLGGVDEKGNSSGDDTC